MTEEIKCPVCGSKRSHLAYFGIWCQDCQKWQKIKSKEYIKIWKRIYPNKKPPIEIIDKKKKKEIIEGLDEVKDETKQEIKNEHK